MRSEKLYDLAPDIPDVMGLRAVRPSAAIVKVMSVPDSQCIRVLTPDDHVNIGFHEILLHDKGEEVLPFVAMSELDYLRRIWTQALFIFMSRFQQDLECLTYQGEDCIMDSFSAGETLSPSVSDLSGPRGPYVTDGPVGHPGTLSSSSFMPLILVDPGGTLPPSDLAGMLPPTIPVGPVGRWGTLPPPVSDPTGPVGQSVTGGPVGHLGTLPSSTFEPAILVDPGGTLPSSDLAGMVLPAIRGSPVGFWGTLPSSDSDPAGQDGPYGTDGPVGHLGTLCPSTSTSEILVDPGGMSTSSDLAGMRGPAPPAESAVRRHGMVVVVMIWWMTGQFMN